MRLGLGLGIGHRRSAAGGGAPALPQLLTDGLVSYVKWDEGITDSGDGTEITQVVGVATHVPGAAGEGPIRNDIGWGQRISWPGNSGAIQFANNDWLVTTDPAVLATFGVTTSDFTVVTMIWMLSSNSNQFIWGIGHTASNRSLAGIALTNTRYVQTVGAAIGGTGTVSTDGLFDLYTRSRFPALTIWRQTGSNHQIFVNDVQTPVLSTTYTWTSATDHSRFAWGARPDLSPDLGMSNGMVKFLGLYNRSLSDAELLQMGRYCGMLANQPIGGWTIDEISPEVFVP